MYPLSVENDAIFFVRKNLDEQNVNDSVMLIDSDSTEFEAIVRKTLPEAINIIHSTAPVQLLDGKVLTAAELEGVSVSNGVISFGIADTMNRLIAFKASDSPYVVSEVTLEYSPEGRMQLNPYSRGSSDNPVLVQCEGRSAQQKTNFKYYSLEAWTSSTGAIARFEYLPLYHYSATKTSYDVAESVYENIINQLTGMVLAIYGQSDKAQYFFSLANGRTPSVNETN